MENWDSLRYLLSVHRRRTLKAAAGELGVNQTTVGRNLAALEVSLGVKLLEKHSDGFILTEAGRRAIDRVEQIESSVLALDRALAGQDERTEGVIRIALPGALANYWFIPALPEFVKKHPKISFELITGGEVVNLAKREADLAIRLVRPDQRELIAKRLGALRLGVYGRKDLFRGQSLPKDRDEIKNYPFIGLYPSVTSDVEAAFLKRIDRAKGSLVRSAAWSSVLHSVSAGLGIGILPEFMTRGRSDLRRVSAAGEERAPLWLVVHPEVQKSRRVRAVIEFFQARANEELL